MERIITGIDVGTTKVCTLIGEVTEEDRLRIVGAGVTPSRGLQRGIVVDVEGTTRAIAASVEKAEQLSGYRVTSAYVGIAGGHISSINSRGVVALSRSNPTIGQEEIDRAMEAAQAIAIPHDRRIIHVIPRGFTLDGQKGIRDPLGMQGFRLEVETHIITGAVASIHNLVRCVQRAGVSINDLILQPVASGEACLTELEREMGVVLADIGGGTTDIAIFIEGSIWHTCILGVAGNHLTHDLTVGLHTSFSTSEEVKIKYGHVIPESVNPSEKVDIVSFGDSPRSSVSRKFISQILEARMTEIFSLIMREIKQSGYDGLLPAGMVLSGGTAELAGIKELGRQIVGLPIRIGLPCQVEGLVDVTRSPIFSTGVGLLLWGMKYGETRSPQENRRWRDIFRGLKKPFKIFLPVL